MITWRSATAINRSKSSPVSANERGVAILATPLSVGFQVTFSQRDDRHSHRGFVTLLQADTRQTFSEELSHHAVSLTPHASTGTDCCAASTRAEDRVFHATPLLPA